MTGARHSGDQNQSYRRIVRLHAASLPGIHDKKSPLFYVAPTK